MINKLAQVAKINTMADGTIRLSIDIIGGDSNDMKRAYELQELDTRIILDDNRNFEEADKLEEEAPNVINDEALH